MPSVNKLDELPERAASVLHFDPAAALAAPENAEVFSAPTTKTVLDAFAAKIAAEPEPIEAARFKALIKEVQKETRRQRSGALPSHSHRAHRRAVRSGV